MVNIELLDRVIAWIEAHPETWEQGGWAAKTECGTSHCIAGWAVHLTHPDAEPMFVDDDLYGGEAADCVLVNGQTYQYNRLAAEVLGLRGRQAGILFGGFNRLADIKAMRDILAEDPDALLHLHPYGD